MAVFNSIINLEAFAKVSLISELNWALAIGNAQELIELGHSQWLKSS